VTMLNQVFEQGGGEHMERDDDVAHAGVLVRQFDLLQDPKRLWLPCPADSWCHDQADRWPSALLSTSAQQLPSPTLGGILLSPTVVINCVYAGEGNSVHASKSCVPAASPSKHSAAPQEHNNASLTIDTGLGDEAPRAAAAEEKEGVEGDDGGELQGTYLPLHTYDGEEGEEGENSSLPILTERRAARVRRRTSLSETNPAVGANDDDEPCTPGCLPSSQQCYSTAWWETWKSPAAAGAYDDCSFPPSQLANALQARQQQPSLHASHNEIVVDTASVLAALPQSIIAFFYQDTSSPEEIASAKAAHELFAATYWLSKEHALVPPLLLLDLQSERLTKDAMMEDLIASGKADSLDAAARLWAVQKPLPFSLSETDSAQTKQPH